MEKKVEPNPFCMSGCADQMNEALEQLTVLETMYQRYKYENVGTGRETLDCIRKAIKALEGDGSIEMESCHLCGAGSTTIEYKVVIKHWCPGSIEKFPEGFLVLEKGSIREAVTEWNSRAQFFKKQSSN